jgi:tRNA nucleotidyltransferase (CCA-adding enzyme)
MSRDPNHPHGSLKPPGAVHRIAQRLEEAGHETWCVGGAVRDALLGHMHLDWDLATAATPKQMRKLFPRTVPVGIDFGTVGVLDDAGVMHEVTTFRRDVHTDGRHAVVEFGASLEDDLARRDFTVNAIAWSPTRRELFDPFGGQLDLDRRIIRAVGEPDERMREDRLRALRGIRFASRLGFTIDPQTWEAIARSAPHLDRLSAERVKQELEKTMEQVARPSQALEMWRRAGALGTLIPALEHTSPQTFASVDELTQPRDGPRNDERRTLRITAVFLDLPHAEAARALRALRFSNRDVAWISGTIERWSAVRETLEAAALGEQRLDASALRRIVAAVGRLRVRTIWRLLAARCAAQAHAQGGGVGSRDGWSPVHSLYREALRTAFRDPVPLELADLAIDGDDLRRAGVSPGPALGRTLARLLDDVLDDPARNTRDALLARVAAIGSANGGEEA